MSVIDHQQSISNGPKSGTTPLEELAGLRAQCSSTDQLPFPDHVAFPTSGVQTPLPLQQTVSPPVTQPFADTISSPSRALVGPTSSSFTGNLAQPQTGSLVDAFSAKRNTTALRHPVLIRSGNSPRTSIRPPKARRLVVHLAVMILLAFTVVGTLLAVLPAGSDAHSSFNPFSPLNSIMGSGGNDPGQIAAQAATATAVTQDGRDPGGNVTYAGVPTAPASVQSVAANDSASTLNRFFYGQCTYWANMRYHQLSGHWVTWLGNAYEWTGGASSAGWVVSSTPNPNGPSIIVLQPGSQGAGGYGHVAVVESSGNGVAHTSNWNWNGAFATTTYVDFHYPVGGTAFVWHP